MLTSGEIKGMRATAEEAMPNTAQVVRVATGADGMGGTTTTESVVGSYRARLGSVSEEDQDIYADKLGGKVGFIISLPARTDVQVRDRIRFDGRQFEVLAAPDRADWELTRRAVVVEVVR
jgi:head-tail adaptor